MKHLVTALVVLLALVTGASAPALAQSADSVLTATFDNARSSLRIGDQEPFGDILTAERTNVFSYQCFYAFSILRDHEETNTGTASKQTNDCVLQIDVTSAGDGTYRYESVEFGVYQSGKGAEMGVGVRMRDAPTGDSYYRVGMDDGDDGAFFEFDASGISFVVQKNGSRVEDVEQSLWNRDKLDGDGRSGVDLTPYDKSYIYGVRWSWYGVGKICGYVWATGALQRGAQMEGVAVHCFVPEGDFPSIANPNLPAFAEVSNGSDGTGQDMRLEIGGRRYDILGPFNPNVRTTSASRDGVDATRASLNTTPDFTPIICARREPDFPSAGEQNTVSAFISSAEVITGANLRLAFYTADSITGTWQDPDQINANAFPDNETGIQYSVDVSALTNPQQISESEYFGTTGVGGSDAPTDVRGKRVPLIRAKPTCLAGYNIGGQSASPFVSLSVTEEW